MTLLDSNVIIDAQNPDSIFFEWAAAAILEAVASAGAAVNPIVVAELCAGKENTAALVQRELLAAGIQLLDLPVGAAPLCGSAYLKYRYSRRKSAGGEAPRIPLPDFFIGAHAELMGWSLATRDPDRIRTYFPGVKLLQPAVP